MNLINVGVNESIARLLSIDNVLAIVIFCLLGVLIYMVRSRSEEAKDWKKVILDINKSNLESHKETREALNKQTEATTELKSSVDQNTRVIQELSRIIDIINRK